MKYFFIIISLFLISCKKENVNKTSKKEIPTEQFQNLDVVALNKKIAGLNLKPKQIMKIHYPIKVGNEGKESIKIDVLNLPSGKTEVTLIHDFIMDDAIKAEKHFLVLNKKNEVITLQKNWQCWQDRGHQDFSIEKCN